MKANINLVVAPAVLLLKQMVSDKQEPRGHSSLSIYPSIYLSIYLFIYLSMGFLAVVVIKIELFVVQ